MMAFVRSMSILTNVVDCYCQVMVVEERGAKIVRIERIAEQCDDSSEAPTNVPSMEDTSSNAPTSEPTSGGARRRICLLL